MWLMLLCASKFATAKIACSFEIEKETPLGGGGGNTYFYFYELYLKLYSWRQINNTCTAEIAYFKKSLYCFL